MSSGARAGKSMPSGAAKEMDSPAPPMCWDLIQGIGCIRPFAFAARPSGPARLSGPARPTGFPSTAKRSHLYICIPGLGICFSPREQSLGVLRGISAARLCTLQCRAAEIPPETDVDASNPRPGAAAGSLSHGQSARSCCTRLKRLDKLLIVRHPSNSRGYTPLQKAHGTGGEMVGDGFKALSGPTIRQGGRREGGRNG